MLHPVSVTGPNSGQKICLQLKPDRELIVFSFTKPAARCLHAIADAEQILHVMTNFMRDHVGLCEIASGTQAVLEFMEKSKVDVNALVFRTIERTGRATGETATG